MWDVDYSVELKESPPSASPMKSSQGLKLFLPSLWWTSIRFIMTQQLQGSLFRPSWRMLLPFLVTVSISAIPSFYHLYASDPSFCISPSPVFSFIFSFKSNTQMLRMAVTLQNLVTFASSVSLVKSV